MTRGIFIYGSCVSRDIFGDRIPNDLNIVRYVARQSIISAGNELPVSLLGIKEASSSFVERCIERDCRGSLYNELKEEFRAEDFLLMDLVDERHGVYKFSETQYATRSIDKLNIMGGRWIPDEAEYVPFGSDEHFELFKISFKQFVDFFKSRYGLERLILLKHKWASAAGDGKAPEPKPMGFNSADSAWAEYQRYYDFVESLVPNSVLNVPESLCIADRDHKWGLAPFHYCAAFYEWALEAIYATIEGRRGNLELLNEIASIARPAFRSVGESSVSKRPLNIETRKVSTVYEFGSLDEFLSRETVRSGIVDIGLDSSELSFLYRDLASDILVVSFHSDLSDTDLHPYFRGGEAFKGSGISNLRLSDPTCLLSTDLPTGWYMGNSEIPNLRTILIRVIKKVFDCSDATRIVFCGSGSGAFAALYYSYFFTDSKCLVYEPETDISKATQGRRDSYVKLAWGLSDYGNLKPYLVDNLVDLYKYGHTNDVFIVQKSGSPRIESHLRPFLQAVGDERIHYTIGESDGLHALSQEKRFVELVNSIVVAKSSSHVSQFSTCSWIH